MLLKPAFWSEMGVSMARQARAQSRTMYRRDPKERVVSLNLS